MVMLSSIMSVMTIPNLFTLLRFFLVPCIVLSMYLQAWFAVAILFILAAITDVLDGFLARLLNEVTVVGALLDTLTDKVLLISCYMAFFFWYSKALSLPLWFLLFVIGTESLFGLISLYYVFIKKNHELSPTRLAKLVGVGQGLFMAWLFLCCSLQITPLFLFYILLGLVAIARTCAFLQYAVIAYDKFVW